MTHWYGTVPYGTTYKPNSRTGGRTGYVAEQERILYKLVTQEYGTVVRYGTGTVPLKVPYRTVLLRTVKCGRITSIGEGYSEKTA